MCLQGPGLACLYYMLFERFVTVEINALSMFNSTKTAI